MTHDSDPLSVHPSGEQSLVVEVGSASGVELDSFDGPVRVEWDHETAMTPLGQLPFIIDFPKGRLRRSPASRSWANGRPEERAVVDGRRQPLVGGTSRMTGNCHVRF